MKLTVKDRIVLPPLLPSQGSYADMVVRKDILDKLVLSQNEIKDVELTTEGERVRWNEEKDTGKEVEFTDLELKMIKEALRKADEEKKLSDDLIGVYEKFIIKS